MFRAHSAHSARNMQKNIINLL